MTRTYLLWITLLIFTSLWTVAVFRYIVLTEYHLLAPRTADEVTDRPRLSTVRTFASRKGIIKRNERTILIRSNDHVKKYFKIKNTAKSFQNFPHNDDLLVRYAGSFKRDWCRIRQARLDWREYLAPCIEHTSLGTKDAGWRAKYRTNATNSLIINWAIRPVGEFSRFFIESRTSSNKTKDIGGDAWRIHINGAASVSPSVFDHKNGTYEVVFLLIEPGVYHLHIVLDYSLCDGLKDPPVDWYKKGIETFPLYKFFSTK